MAEQASGRPVVRGAVLGVACSVAFAAGIAFDRYLGGENLRVKAAILEANDFEQWVRAVLLVEMQTGVYEDLKAIHSPEDIVKVKSRYRDDALGNIARYEREIEEMPEVRRRLLQRLRSNLSPEFRRRLDATSP
jgi:hypothetical protein